MENCISHGLPNIQKIYVERERKENTVNTMGKSGISCRNCNKEVQKKKAHNETLKSHLSHRPRQVKCVWQSEQRVGE